MSAITQPESTASTSGNTAAGKLLAPYTNDPSRKIVVALGDRLTVPQHHEVIKGVPEGMTPEQAAIQAEVNPAGLKHALKRDNRRIQLMYLATDAVETDAACGCVAAFLIGAFAVPLTKFAVDNAAINKTFYTETMVGQNVYVVTPTGPQTNQAHAKHALKSATTATAAVSGNTFQSIVATRNILPLMNAMEKMRAQQLRLGFFSVWKGTGAEMFWFGLSYGTTLAFEAMIDRVWNREWYVSLAERKVRTTLAATGNKMKEEQSKDGENKQEQSSSSRSSSSTTTKGKFLLDSPSGSSSSPSQFAELAAKTGAKTVNQSSNSNIQQKKQPGGGESDNDETAADSEEEHEEQQKAITTTTLIRKKNTSFEAMLPAGARNDFHHEHLTNLAFSAKNNLIEHAICGAFGGALAVFATYHAEVVATKCVEDYQNSVKSSARRQYTSMLDCYLKTHQQFGVPSLYYGVGPVFLRAASFWGIAFGLRSGLLALWGYCGPSDYVRMMKRLHFDFNSVDKAGEQAKKELREQILSLNSSSSSKAGKTNQKRQLTELQELERLQQSLGEDEDKKSRRQRAWEFFTGSRFSYAGHVFYCPPFLVNFAFSTAAAAIARDLGVVFVRKGVEWKSAVSYAVKTVMAQTSTASGTAGIGAARATLEKGLWADAIAFGKSAASTVPARLPFSVVRTGLVLALFDSFRMAHARRWCGQLKRQRDIAKGVESKA